ncbi:MAG: phosphoheptose isomerase [Flavobacteriales bacterium]|nr:phosphoheptose isomerase [Flavobacteriales bacterium]MBP9080039.1 phosphoheptose isomerase [Flavobacteriales bacterium]
MDSNLQEAFDHGMRISPKLPEGKKNFLIDIDGTICEDIPNEEPGRMATAVIYDGALAICNGWYAEGHIITFFTSRTEEHRAVTTEWLDRHGFKYHGILFGKPRGGNYHWIDNHIVRATRYDGKFTRFVERDAKIEAFEE